MWWKRCKKIRGLIRLLRGSFEDYGTENEDFRNTARLLAAVREATVDPETLAALHQWGVELQFIEPDDPAFERAADEMRSRSQTALAGLIEDRTTIDEVRGRLTAARDRIESWEVDGTGFDAVEAGLGKSYGRGHVGFADCREARSPERLHDWRKRAKYTRYHLRLLGPIAPDVLGDANERLHDLTDSLGLDHDIADLVELVDLQGDTAGYPKFLAVADARRADLQRQALEQGLGCYGEVPQAFVDRIDAYWNGARSTGVPIAV